MKSVKVFIFGLIKFLLDNLLKPILRCGWRLYYRKLDYTKPLPKCKNPLLLKSVNVLSLKIRKREVIYIF